MSIRLLLLFSLALPGIAFASAGSGEFMGYRLGDTYVSKYPNAPDASSQVTTTGKLLITAEQPVKPDDIEKVTLLTTYDSKTIGYITASQRFATEAEAREFGKRYFGLLRAKYPDWMQGWELMNSRMQIVAVSLRKAPYDLRLKLTQDAEDPRKLWRISMTLSWDTSSEQAAAWQKKADAEQIIQQEDARKQLLKESDIRGL